MNLDDLHLVLGRIDRSLEEIKDDVRRINGRVDRLEEWRKLIDIEGAKLEGRREALVTKSQFIVAVAVANGIVATIVGIIGVVIGG